MNVQYKDKQGQLVWEKTDRIIVTLDDEEGQQFNISEDEHGLRVCAHPRISIAARSAKAVILNESEADEQHDASRARRQLRRIYSMAREQQRDPDYVADRVWGWAEARKGLDD